MNKFILFLMIIVMMSIFLTGCWNYIEVEKMSLVAGMAVDKDNLDNQYEITTEIIDVNSADKNPTFSSLVIQSKGKSIFDCMRNMINISAKKLYWSHATTVIISKDLAKEGILPVLDWIVRDSEPRLTIYFLIADTDKAKDILSLEPLSTEIRSYEIESMILANKKLAKIPDIKVYELVNDLSKEGIHPVIPTIGETINEGKKTMHLSGGAILNKDVLVGFLDLDEVKNYLFIRNQIKGGVLPISLYSTDTEPNITLEIFHNKTKITPIISNGDLSIDIKINTQVGIGELDTPIDFMEEGITEKIKLAAEESLEKNISQLIKRIQEDFSLDIFGFGVKVKEKMPELWKEIGDNWDEVFKELKITVNADIHIRGSGHTSNTIGYTK